jgi:hypothetical protein
MKTHEQEVMKLFNHGILMQENPTSTKSLFFQDLGCLHFSKGVGSLMSDHCIFLCF